MAEGTDTATTTTDTSNPQAAPATQPPVVTLTPEQYATELQKAKDAGAAAARRALEGKKPPQAEPPKSQPDPAPTALPPSHDQSFEDSLADVLADFPGMSRKQRALVRDLARQKRPPDVDAFVADLVETLGVKRDSQPNPNPQASIQTPPNSPNNGTPPAAASTPPPPPVTKVTSDLPADVRKWSEEQWIAYYTQHGANPGQPLSWQNASVHRDIGRRLEAAMQHVRIKPR